MKLYISIEGVESKEQVEFLMKQKYHSIQGYYFKPLPVDGFEALLAKNGASKLYN